VAARGAFDHYICRRDDPTRGRGEDEVPRMLAAALRAQGVDEARISVIVDEQEAIQAGLAMAAPGDLLLVFSDNLARGWKQIVHFKPERTVSDVPPPKPSRAVPRQGVADVAPADDLAPATMGGDATAPKIGLGAVPVRGDTEDLVLIRDTRGVIVAREQDD
jgi:cyanophycin synthetase